LNKGFHSNFLEQKLSSPKNFERRPKQLIMSGFERIMNLVFLLGLQPQENAIAGADSTLGYSHYYIRMWDK
jgi:hypothetical protein